MALTDMTVRQAKATGKDYTLGDLDGLSLGVSAQGGKSWHFRHTWLGKQKRMSLGTYPEISLRDARARRDEARALLAKGGINPRLHREKERQAVSLAAEHTFQAVYESISLGNRGQRVPDWQLDPLKRRLAQTILRQMPPGVDTWHIYHALMRPSGLIQGQSPIDAVTPENLHVAVHLVCSAVGEKVMQREGLGM